MAGLEIAEFEVVLLHLAVLIIASRGLGEVFARLGQPAIVGEVLAGIMLGPALLGLITVTPVIWLFTAIGIYFLLFLAGFEEIDVFHLTKALRPRVALAATASFFVPFLLYTLFFHVWFGVEPAVNALIASALALTSLGVVLRCVIDLDMTKSQDGMNLLSMTILNELSGLLVASIAFELLMRPEAGGLITLPLRVLIFFALTGVIGYFAIPPVIRAVERAFKVKEASFATLVALILLFSYFATHAGLHGALGALTLGFALSRARSDPIVSRTVDQLKGFAHGIFIPIFFAGAGLYVTREFLLIEPVAALMIALIVPAGKLFAGYIGSRILPVGARSLAITFGQLAKGGVELAILPLAVELGALSSELYSFTVLLIVALTIAASTLLRMYGVKTREMVTAAESPASAAQRLRASSRLTSDCSHHRLQMRFLSKADNACRFGAVRACGQ